MDHTGSGNESDETRETEPVDAYLKTCKSAHTRRAYGADLRAFFGSDAPSSEVIDGVTPKDVDRFVRTQEHSGLAAATVRRRLSALRRFFDWCTAEGIAATNPARHGRVRRPMSDAADSNASASTETLTREEAERFVNSFDGGTKRGRRDRALVLTALHCALRRSELAALDATDLRMVGRYWTLEIRPRQGQDATTSDKSRENGPAAASVKVPEHVADELDALRDAWGRHGAMFRSLSNRNRGARLTPDAIYKIVKEAGARAGLERAGLEDVTPETLRQTGLQLAVDGGAPLRQVQAHARHAGAEPTARRADPGTRLGDSAADYVNVGA